MKKYILLASVGFTMFLGGCSHFKFNYAMCDSIANDPNAVMPAECRNYNEEEAEKAFNKTKLKTKTTSEMEDELEFHKNKDKEEK